MKYKVSLGKKVYEVEVEEGKAMLLDEYEAKAPVPPAVAAPIPAADQTPQTVLAALAPKFLERDPVEYRCNCSLSCRSAHDLHFRWSIMG